MESREKRAGGTELEYLYLEDWEREPGLFQGVTLRREARGPNEGLGFLAGLAEARGFTGACRPSQVHGQRVLDIRFLDGGGTCGFRLEKAVDGDGLVGVEPGLLGVISVADCVPVFLLARARRAWGLLHAGWRGTAAGVLEEGVAQLADLSGATAGELELYLGPAICGQCYEVGRQVAVWMGAEEPGSPGLVGRTQAGGYSVDLRAILAHKARGLGIRPGNIRTSVYCTRCNNDLFHSFRGEGQDGLKRMWAFMGYAGPKA